MADMNYVSPLTSDLTDYYTKSEVDELQQGDAATYATSAEIVAGDNAVKGWVVSQGFLTEHQDLTNYATISYVDDAIADIEPSSGGMAVRVVSTLPGVGEENVLYLVFVDNEDEDNRYAEYIWVDTLNDYEMLGYGSSEGGIIPDLTDYATKQWVEAKGYLDSSDLIGYATVGDLAAVATSGDYDDLSNKPTIPSLTGYATQTYVDDAVGAIDAKDVSYDNAASGLEAANIKNAIDEVNAKVEAIDIPAAPDLSSYATKVELSAKANSADLAAVATTGSYNDLSNKPTIPSTSGLASETYVDNAIAAIKGSEIDNDMNWIDEVMAMTSAYHEIQNNVSAVGLSGDYDDLTNKPTIPSITGLATETYVDDAVAGISVPANTSDLTNDSGFITSSDLPDTSGFVESSDLATVATTGDYDDLINKPTIPVLPTLATVATSGSYNDLSDKPTIPTSGIDGVGNGSLALLLMLLGGVNNNYTRAMMTVNPSTVAEFEEAFKKGILIYLNGSNLDITSSQFSSINGFTWYQFNNASKVYQPSTTTVNKLGNANYYLKLTDNTGLSVFQGNPGYGTEGLKKAIFKYVNTTSGLTATTFQEAIDELAAASGSSVGYTYDSTTKTVSLSGVSDDNL